VEAVQGRGIEVVAEVTEVDKATVEAVEEVPGGHQGEEEILASQAVEEEILEDQPAEV
jgi:hypothetical protein